MSGGGQGSAERAFDRLYGEQHQAVFAFLLGRAGDRETARDLLQEVFLRAWRHVDDWCELPPERRRAWVYAVARNLVIDSHRGRGSDRAAMDALRRAAEAEGPAALAAPASEDPAARAEMGERMAVLERAIARLPERQRVVLSLHVVGGLNSSQVGELLDEPPGTVRYRLSEARRQLATALEADR